jgi:cobalamin synthase
VERNVKKKHAVPFVDKLLLKQKKLYVLRDIQYGPLLFFLIVLYLILKTISLEVLLKKKEAARIEYPAIRTTSFVSIVVYLQREQRVFFLHFPLFCHGN